MAPVALLPNKRRKTTTLIHYGHVDTKPRDLQSRVLSPTRRHNPQPLGLVYQSPLHSNAQGVKIYKEIFARVMTWCLFELEDNMTEGIFVKYEPYAIWNPDFRHTRTRFPTLVGHLDLTNFSSGPMSHVSPYEERGGQPTIHYSLQSTSRFSYREPSQYTLGEGKKWPTHRPYRPEPDGPAVGIIPPGLPRLSEERNLVNVRQGSDKKSDKCGWSNAALREVWRSTGHANIACKR